HSLNPVPYRSMFSIIINSISPQKFQAVSQQYARALAGHPHEIIGIHDARSMAEGYNRGLARAKGDLLLFSHDDIEILTPPALSQHRLLSHLTQYDIVGIAGTDRLIGPKWIAAGPPHTFGQVLEPSTYLEFRDHPFSLTLFSTPRPLVPNIQALDGVFLA